MRTQTKTLISANTEYSISIPAGITWLSLQCRTSYAVRVSDTSGLVAGGTDPFATIKADTGLTVPLSASPDAQTIYLASATAGVIVEYIY
jgi:hypothetical protein